VLVLSRFLDGDEGGPCLSNRLLYDYCRDAGAVQETLLTAESPDASGTEAATEDEDLEDLRAGAKLLHAQV
jgi:hypothetical protein